MKDGKHFILDVLLKISPEEIQRKQQAIAAMASTLQYSLVPQQQQLAHAMDHNIRWDPPIRDAVDVILENIFQPSTIHQPVLVANATLRAEEMRKRCVNNEIVHRGTVYSRGLAWHKLRQICRKVDIMINMEDGTVFDLRIPAQVEQMHAHQK
jgi:hypothetical protein